MAYDLVVPVSWGKMAHIKGTGSHFPFHLVVKGLMSCRESRHQNCNIARFRRSEFPINSARLLR